MDNLPCVLGQTTWILILSGQRMDFQNTAENQASKAAVSAPVFLSHVSVGLFIPPQASAASSKQENLHFHSEADIINVCCSIFFVIMGSPKSSVWDLGLSSNAENEILDSDIWELWP